MSHDISIFVPIVLFGFSLYLYQKTSPARPGRFVYFVSGLLLSSLIILYGAAYYFTGNGIDEATMYHLKYGLGGAGFLEYGLLITVAVLLLISSIVILTRVISKAEYSGSRPVVKSVSSYSLVAVAFVFNPASIDLYNLQREITGTAANADPDTLQAFTRYYKKPEINPSGKERKNIVFVYAESLERTYFDESIFPGLIKGLRQLEASSTTFSNITQVAGTGWTVGGMTASLCGIPLFTPSHGNSMSGMDQFLSSAVCASDLLRRENYHLTFMGGADLNFAGKGKLLKSHGFSDVLGLIELEPELDDKSYKTSWGLFDDTLFDRAYEQFLSLSKQGNNFALFTLTLDTHHPKGHPSRRCDGRQYKDGSNPILNAVACSDFLISEFVKKILASDYASQTVVVVASDHLAMRNTASDLLRQKPRRNLFMIIDPEQQSGREINAIGSTLDIGPTILPVAGFSADVGLGRNLLDSKADSDERKYIHHNLNNWWKPVTAFWDFPTLKNNLRVNVATSTVNLDGREFQAPVLIQLNENLETVLKFQFDKSKGHKTLVQHRNDLAPELYFLLIDECENARKLDRNLTHDGLCMLAGRGKKYTRISQIETTVDYSAGDIRTILNMQ